MELKIDQLTKRFNDFTAVNDVSYKMNKGIYGLLGINGAGKTTMMRMICTLLKPTEGSITYDGQDIWRMDNEYRRILGYLPQDFGFYPDFTAEDYLMYIASIKGIRPGTAKRKVDELLHLVGLEKVRRKKMKKFSGGMKRRAGIAQAMLNDPKVLVLDEPTAGLDPNERIRFRNLISELAQDRLVLLSTHIVSDVEYIANNILLMKDGQFACSGTAEELTEGIDDKVWTCKVARSEVDFYMKHFKVSNIKTITDGVELRVLSSEKPCGYARQETASLEDVFLYYFGEKAGEENAVV